MSDEQMLADAAKPNRQRLIEAYVAEVAAELKEVYGFAWAWLIDLVMNFFSECNKTPTELAERVAEAKNLKKRAKIAKRLKVAIRKVAKKHGEKPSADEIDAVADVMISKASVNRVQAVMAA